VTGGTVILNLFSEIAAPGIPDADENNSLPII
jgi:hypothetical protein